VSKQQKGMIHLPGNKVHQFLHAPVPAQRAPDIEPYPDEYAKIKAVGDKINARFAYKNVNNDEWPDVIAWILEEFEKIGFAAAVEPMDAMKKLPDGTMVPVMGSDGFPMRVPSIAIIGRTGGSQHAEEETDHDRVRHGIVTGKADGVKGYIREDGQLHEEPRKKLIY
jgi:hypothetical protein